jgi:UDP-3-O-[3-hydroxymyristoyl] glucosamine N-acyltransferase
VISIQMTEPQRRRLWRAARREGDDGLARALALECPTRRGLSELPCPCHTEEADGTIVHPTAHVEGVIGARTRIGPGAYVGALTTIGADCVIGPGAVIGADGFGYSRDGLTDEDALREGVGRWERKDQRFGVIIGNDVDVGANVCVDRGSWRDTTICSGTKIDNLVHVAHNVEIGRNCLVIAGAMLGGSCEIGEGSWIAPHALVREHVRIGCRAFVALGAVVVRDVSDGESVRGVPAKSFQRGQADRDVRPAGGDLAA